MPWQVWILTCASCLIGMAFQSGCKSHTTQNIRVYTSISHRMLSVDIPNMLSLYCSYHQSSYAYHLHGVRCFVIVKLEGPHAELACNVLYIGH